jgi:excisionase family DNA binding protein
VALTGTENYKPHRSELEPPLTARQCWELLQISKNTLYRLIRDGELQPTYVGHSPRFLRDDVRAYLERNREIPPEMREAGFPASEPLADESVDGNDTAAA